MKPYRIIVADDHALLRRGLRRIIEEAEEMSVVGEAGDGVELVELLDSVKADLVILDISMPRMRGIEAVSAIKQRGPETKVLMLTMHRDKEYLHQSVSAGADGYLLKEDVDEELFSAMSVVRKGAFYVSPSLEKVYAELMNREEFDGEENRRGYAVIPSAL